MGDVVRKQMLICKVRLEYDVMVMGVIEGSKKDCIVTSSVAAS